MDRLKRAVALLAVLSAGQACVAEAPGQPTAEVVDSAGVRIVTHDLTVADPPVFGLLGAHDRQVGVVEGAEEDAFSRIVDLAVDERDRLIVSDAGEPVLRVFDGEGSFRARLGRRGEGPGELAAPPAIAGVAGDTVFAFDGALGRLSTFLSGGTFLESMPLQSGGGGRLRSALRLSDGSYLGVSPWTAPDGAFELHELKLMLDSVVVERLDPEGQPLDTLRVMADRPMLRLVQSADGGMVRVLQAEPPFLPRAFLASNGSVTASGRSDVFELRIRSGTGAPTIVRVVGAEHPAGADEIRAWQLARLREELGDGPLDPGVRQLELDHLPSRLPAFSDVRVSSDGDVWVARSALDEGEGIEWLVFAPGGRLRGTVQAPPGLRLLVVRPTFVVGAVTDDLGVPYIRRHPLSDLRP